MPARGTSAATCAARAPTTAPARLTTPNADTLPCVGRWFYIVARLACTNLPARGAVEQGVRSFPRGGVHRAERGVQGGRVGLAADSPPRLPLVPAHRPA